MEIISGNTCFGGVQGVYSHNSRATDTPMTFGLFLPREARRQKVSLLWFLSGLTCSHGGPAPTGAVPHAEGL